MYYDLITSLPRLPHFEHADRLPITPLRLARRLLLLRPEHAEQLEQVRALVGWRPERTLAQNEEPLVAAYARLMAAPLESPLRDYADFRLRTQGLLAALRHKRDGLELPKAAVTWGLDPHEYHIRTHWNEPAFGLKYLYPWLATADECLRAGDAIGVERLMMELNWRWLTRLAEPHMFDLEAVVAFVFKWEVLRTRLAWNAAAARIRFGELIEKVTQYEQL